MAPTRQTWTLGDVQLQKYDVRSRIRQICSKYYYIELCNISGM